MDALSLDALLDLERRGWDALCDGTGGAFYGDLMSPEGLMVLVDGAVLDRDAVVASLVHAPPWDGYELDDVRCVPLGPHACSLVYRATARRRGEPPFEAHMGSTYVFLEGRPRLALHQQTTATHATPAAPADAASTATRPVLQQPVIDAVDIRAAAEFYRELLGLHYRAGDELADGREPDSEDWLVLLDDDGRRILTFQRTEELKPTTWPSPEVPMQLHLDLTVPDRDSLDAAHDHALRLGGRLVLDRSDDEDEPLYVFADPAGHPFCVFVG